MFKLRQIARLVKPINVFYPKHMCFNAHNNKSNKLMNSEQLNKNKLADIVSTLGIENIVQNVSQINNTYYDYIIKLKMNKYKLFEIAYDLLPKNYYLSYQKFIDLLNNHKDQTAINEFLRTAHYLHRDNKDDKFGIIGLKPGDSLEFMVIVTGHGDSPKEYYEELMNYILSFDSCKK